MKASRIKLLRRMDQSLLRWDASDQCSFEDQLETKKLGELLEQGFTKLSTFWGLLFDIFTFFYNKDVKMVRQIRPDLVVNRNVFNAVRKMTAAIRLREHTYFRRTASTDAVVRIAKAILDAIPPKVSNKAKQLECLAPPSPPPTKATDDDDSKTFQARLLEDPEDEEEEVDDDTKERRAAMDQIQLDLADETEDEISKVIAVIAAAIDVAATEACEAAQEMEELLNEQGFSCDPDGQNFGGIEDPEKALKLRDSLAYGKEIRELLDTFGKDMISSAIKSQDEKILGPGSTTASIELGDDIERMPGDESYLFYRSDKEPELSQVLQVLLALGLAEGTLLQEATKTNRVLNRGSMIFLLDRSGSMSDKKMLFAKGLALALQKLAEMQGREVWVIPFDDIVDEPINFSPRRGIAMLESILAVGSIKARGGTNIGLAVQAAIDHAALVGQPGRPPDIVVLTDGLCPIPGEDGQSPTDKVRKAARAELRAGLTAVGARLKGIFVQVQEQLYSNSFNDLRILLKECAETANDRNIVDVQNLYERTRLEGLFQTL